MSLPVSVTVPSSRAEDPVMLVAGRLMTVAGTAMGVVKVPLEVAQAFPPELEAKARK